jgi:hypothetical protein
LSESLWRIKGWTSIKVLREISIAEAGRTRGFRRDKMSQYGIDDFHEFCQITREIYGSTLPVANLGLNPIRDRMTLANFQLMGFTEIT